MCSIELMVARSISTMLDKEAIKEIEREAAKMEAASSLGAERIRRSTEEERLDRWHDTESRKVSVSLGATEVAAAGAGVQIEGLVQQWAQAHMDL